MVGAVGVGDWTAGRIEVGAGWAVGVFSGIGGGTVASVIGLAVGIEVPEADAVGADVAGVEVRGAASVLDGATVAEGVEVDDDTDCELHAARISAPTHRKTASFLMFSP